MSKRLIKPIIILLAGMFCSAQAIEIRPLAQIQFPAKTNVAWEIHGKKDNTKMDADLVYEIGSEFLWYTNYIRYGAGLAYKSPQKKGSVTAAPGAIPVWLSAGFGLFNKQAVVQPYAAVRFGTLAPLSSDGNWWESPLNYFVSGGVGAIFPYGIGLEVVYDYSSLKKSFKSIEKEYRVSSGRIGIQLSVGFSLGDDAKPTENSTKNSPKDSAQSNTPAEGTQENTWSALETEMDNSTSEDTNTADSTASETPSETDPAEAPVTEENATETDTVATEPQEDAPVEETPAEAPAEEVSENAEESAAETVAESEPEAAPAPVEEPKPAAKPAKKAAKKSSKKSTKKSTKKSSKKSSKKATKKKK